VLPWKGISESYLGFTAQTYKFVALFRFFSIQIIGYMILIAEFSWKNQLGFRKNI
jgi:hypothetical protein